MAVTILLYQSQQWKIVKGALDLLCQIAEFADYLCCEELSSAVTKVSDILIDFRLETQKQSSILDFVEKRLNAKE